MTDLRHPAQPVVPASSSDDGKLRHPDMRERKQITVKMTEQFAKDLNLIFASYGLTDVSFVVRESVSCQADAIRDRIAVRQAAGKPPYIERPTVNLVGQEAEGER